MIKTNQYRVFLADRTPITLTAERAVLYSLKAKSEKYSLRFFIAEKEVAYFQEFDGYMLLGSVDVNEEIFP